MTSALCSRDISVVIQGPTFNGQVNIAQEAIGSVLKYLPEAEVILSTHDDEPRIDCDEVIVVRAKSSRHFTDVNGNRNNVNKLISSVMCGLERVSREYCIKLRTDHLLTSDAIVERIRTLASNDTPAALFTRRIAVSNLFLRNPCKIPYLFHLTDTLQFGRTEDLRKLWDIGPLPDDFIFLPGGPRTNPIGTFQGYTSFRLLPEQAIFLRFAQRNGLNVDLEHISHTSYRLFNAWEDLLVENFELYDWQNLGVAPPKRFLSAPYAPTSLMTELDLQTLRTERTSSERALRYADVLINKYLLCWFHRHWLVSVGSLVLFSLSSRFAMTIRDLYRRVSGAGRL
ncbi:WavE lipopolysaccharide synthesis family protein [Pseudomonas sp. SCB32]|uniref:WavE lipopolysaccharide synthesis family protein n=1 Tax=Pseudomonas sp. SCB32 TaxID=2653853 RepID=UPI001264D842|nr:WavE lipopolysaccharide synthesis family protein [Pseudomonas sp. SCB32]